MMESNHDKPLGVFFVKCKDGGFNHITRLCPLRNIPMKKQACAATLLLLAALLTTAFARPAAKNSAVFTLDFQKLKNATQASHGFIFDAEVGPFSVPISSRLLRPRD
jgi:hypothetical protein